MDHGALKEMKVLSRKLKQVGAGVNASAELLGMESDQKPSEMDGELLASLERMATGLEGKASNLRRLIRQVKLGSDAPDMFEKMKDEG